MKVDSRYAAVEQLTCCRSDKVSGRDKAGLRTCIQLVADDVQGSCERSLVHQSYKVDQSKRKEDLPEGNGRATSGDATQGRRTMSTHCNDLLAGNVEGLLVKLVFATIVIG